MALSKKAYEKHKKRTAANQRKLAKAGRNVGRHAPPTNLDRKSAAFGSFRVFLETYFRHRFTLAWSPDHLTVIADMERTANEGGKYALAMPRGSGKTTLSECLVLWVLLTGRRKFVPLIGSSRPHAMEMIQSIKAELEGNDLLLQDFGEVCHYVQGLEGIANRAKGQLYNSDTAEDVQTHIGWKTDQIIFPTIDGSAASGAIVKVAGINGRIRGMKFTAPDGRVIRPDMFVIDDAQTDASAKSHGQCHDRDKIISGAILGLAGPDKQIAGVFLCTVIRRGDLADSYLDKENHPEFQGRRFKLIYAMPKSINLWEDYFGRRSDELRNGGNGSQATAWYAEHRALMDEGVVIAWPQRHKPDELSAVQHAMNLYFADKAAFAAEYQNEPLEEKSSGEQLDAGKIAVRLNGLGRGVLPLRTSKVTAFVDVQQSMLFWLVAGWSDDFGGSIVDYGTWPDQRNRRYFSKSNVQYTFETEHRDKNPGQPMPNLEGLIYWALSQCVPPLLGRTFARTDGTPFKIERLCIDTGFKSETVFEWAQQFGQSNTILPSKGAYIGATSRPYSEWTVKPDTIQLGGHRGAPGTHYHIVGVGNRARRRMDIIANYWKSFVYDRLITALGDNGALTLWGLAGQDHRLLADHFCSEAWVDVSAKDRTVREWKQKPERDDNDFFDCLVGAAAAASSLGCTLLAGTKAAPAPKPSTSSQEEARRKREAYMRAKGYAS